MISPFSLQLSRWFYAFFLFPFPFLTTSLLCAALMPLPLNGARCTFIRGSLVQQLLPLLQFHPSSLPLIQQEVWPLMQSWHNFNAWMLALIHSLLSCIRWTPMLAILLDGRFALMALWSLPLPFPSHLRYPRTTTTPTMMMMMWMEMLALSALMRCLFDTLTLCHLRQKGEVVLDCESNHS